MPLWALAVLVPSFFRMTSCSSCAVLNDLPQQVYGERTAVIMVAAVMVVRVTNEPWRAREGLPPRSKGRADEAASCRVRGADDRC